MNRDELTSILRDAGLSPYQADAYVSLLELGASPATDVAETSSVPDPRIYDVLRDLEQQGYVETYQQGSLHARAHDPQEVLDDLRDRAQRFTEAAEEIKERWNQPPMENNKISIVKRFDTVLDRAEGIIQAAENQVQICASPDQFRQLKSALSTALDGGADVKLSLHHPDDKPIPDVSELADAATEARDRLLPSPFVVIVDRRWTCFAPHNRSINQYGVVVNDRTHAYVFHWFFQTCLWEVWETVYSTRSEEPPCHYVDLRQCVRDIEPLVNDGATVDAQIEGFDTETGDDVTIEGRITGVEYTGGSDGVDGPPLSQLVGQVSLVVDTDDGEYTVGGWGAVLEEIEATRITVQSVSDAEAQ